MKSCAPEGVLLEFLAGGDRPEDARERARAFATRPGCRAILVGAPDSPEAPAGSAAVDVPAHAWRDEVELALAGSARATLVLAGDEAIEREPAFLELAPHRRHWPTELCGDPARDRRALDSAIAAQARGASARDSLWDGAYLLVPGIPDDAAIELIVDAFALLAAERPSLDLVFLGDAPRRLAGLAADFGVAWRVHWAGPSPLRAECTWLAGASGIVLTDRECLRPALTLRALAAGSPVRVAGDGARARHLHAWLAEWGLAANGVPLRAGAVAEALESALAGAADAALLRERARRVALRHEPASVLARLLGASDEPARRLAA